MVHSLVDCSYKALLAGAERVSAIQYDAQGYAASWKDNLNAGLPLSEIERDFGSGAGHELDRKLRAAHSSAALVVNTFGPWRPRPSSLAIGGVTGFHSMCFEGTCPIWPQSTPPHLDLIAQKADLLVAVESKCTEWMTPKRASFAPVYEELKPSTSESNWTPWFEQMLRLRGTYQLFDSAQIIKHAFGLLSCHKNRSVRLIYLYWEPRNGEDWPECREHREQADDLAHKVKCSTVRLTPMSYSELWEDWQRHTPPSHLDYLRTRYDIEV